ncbi:hypothetical protein SASPL_146101 [Salvia splendens]|uniref:Rapid ALkalinization Factor n=1 Tax=Salvia splendens TaxID=180675 RepID=A0A8X8Z889_SALSN|nr:hypothetical protein SASPL_146101 [Salvia splendens]
MTKTLAMMLTTLLVVSTFLPLLAEDIGNPALGKGGIPGSPPKTPGNPYRRGCEVEERCRDDPPSRVASDNGNEDVDKQNLFHDEDLLDVAPYGAPVEAPVGAPY